MTELVQQPKQCDATISLPTPADKTVLQEDNPSPSHNLPPQHSVANEEVACVSSDSGKTSRRSNFTPNEDLILVREVAASKAHIAPHGKKGELFAKAAAAANDNPALGQVVTQKSIQDRYTRLQKEFDEGDKKESAMSGIGGEVGEMIELLSEMRQARDDKEGAKSQKREEVTALEAEKEEISAMLVSKALNRHAPGPSSGSASEVGSPIKVGKGNGKRRREVEEVGSEMISFSEAMKETELVRADVENRKLELEEKRLRIETEERAKDGQERRADHGAQTKLDLDKFRLMMDSQASMMKEIVKAMRRDA